MMHCHVCGEDVPLGEVFNHVRLVHPDACPTVQPVEIHMHMQQPMELDAREISRVIQRNLGRGR
jgi:hypothetical protein